MFSSKKFLVAAAIRPSHLSVMLSPLLPHQSQAVYPPPAQYNDLSGYSIPIPPPHFNITQANMAMQAHRQPQHMMKAIVVHRFVQNSFEHPCSLNSNIIKQKNWNKNFHHSQKTLVFHGSFFYLLYLLFYLNQMAGLEVDKRNEMPSM